MQTEDGSIDWVFWLQMPNVKLYEAVALSLGIDPDEVRFNRDAWTLGGEDLFDKGQDFKKRMRLAKARIEEMRVKSSAIGDASMTEITLASFVALAIGLQWNIPGELYQLADGGAEDAASESKHNGPWPWGAHETKLLAHLSEAAKKYWANYDPTDPSTANTNAEVTEFLESRGVSKRVAEVMAQILRADGLRPGPR